MEKQIIYEIYKVTNKLNGKIYIGYTKMGINSRIHKHNINALYGLDSKFYRAIRKYGIENFTWKCIDSSTNQKEIHEKEKHWIEYYDTFKTGYNMTLGGDGGNTYKNFSPERYQQLRDLVSANVSGQGNPNHSGYTDEEIVNFAVDCYIENEFNWHQSKWFEICKEKKIPQNLAKCRFNGGGLKGMKIEMVKKLNQLGYENILNIRYTQTMERRQKTRELFLGASWYHNDYLKKNKQLMPGEVTNDWLPGRINYNKN